MIRQLEDLPNELIWVIFEYIPSMDLFQIFLNLNQRLNTILRLINFRLDLFYTNQKEFQYYQHTMLPNMDSNRIESVYIDDITNRVYSISIFKSLRSLTIHHLRTENIKFLGKNVLSQLKQLEYLRLQSEFILVDSDVTPLTNVVFSAEMPSLTTCDFAFQDFARMTFNHLSVTNRTLSLKTLVIDQWCQLEDFIRLLQVIPNIQRLTVRLFSSDMEETIYPSLITTNDQACLVPHLVYLRAKLAEISPLIAAKTLFPHLPSQLRELSFSTWSIEHADSNTWQTILSSKFPHLKHFRLIISLNRIPPNYPVATITDLDNIVQPFNQSKYFLDHHWNVLININERDRLKFVVHTIPYPIENFQTTLYNIRRCTSSSSIIKSAYRYVSKLTLTLHDDLAPLSVTSNEYRYFPNINELIMLSNITSDYQQFPSVEYFNNLKNMINLTNITSLHFSEETHQYPIELINLFLTHLPKLKSLTLPHRLYICLKPQLFSSLKTLTLIFAMHSPIFPPVIRMRYLVPSNQILVNDLILELVRTISSTFSQIQTLTVIVRELDDFNEQFSDWLKKNFSVEQNILYDLFIVDRIIRFHF